MVEWDIKINPESQDYKDAFLYNQVWKYANNFIIAKIIFIAQETKSRITPILLLYLMSRLHVTTYFIEVVERYELPVFVGHSHPLELCLKVKIVPTRCLWNVLSWCVVKAVQFFDLDWWNQQQLHTWSSIVLDSSNYYLQYFCV